MERWHPYNQLFIYLKFFYPKEREFDHAPFLYEPITGKTHVSSADTWVLLISKGENE